MKKSFAKRFSPQVYNNSKRRLSVKENYEEKGSGRSAILDSSKILLMRNEGEITQRGKKGRCQMKRSTEPVSSARYSNSTRSTQSINSARSTKANILELRDSIRSILDESIKVNTQMRRFKERLETSSTLQNNSNLPSRHPDFDESSIHYSFTKDHSALIQINELKGHLGELNAKLEKREERIRVKNLENAGLQYKIFSLSHKLDKIKKGNKGKKHEKESRFCEVF